jgi:hypothetical protein
LTKRLICEVTKLWWSSFCSLIQPISLPHQILQSPRPSILLYNGICH